MKTQLFIPNKCKVGYNKRTDTYSGKLGYVIAHDGKVWRKENSWESWREKYESPEETEKRKRQDYDSRHAQQIKQYAQTVEAAKNEKPGNGYSYNTNIITAFPTLEKYLKQYVGDYADYRFYPGKVGDKSIEPLEFENVPTEGFVLNKKAGGTKWSWNTRQTYSRVWDPRGFEFEITIPNLLFILQECSSHKGKGLDGKFVYSWDGKDLVLLPEGCEDYKESQVFTTLQSGKVPAKELKEGCFYKTKRQEDLMYMGKFLTYHDSWISHKQAVNKDFTKKNAPTKTFLFLKGNDIVELTSVATLAAIITTTADKDYATKLEKMLKDKRFTGTSSIEATPIEKDFVGHAYKLDSKGVYREFDVSGYAESSYSWTKTWGHDKNSRNVKENGEGIVLYQGNILKLQSDYYTRQSYSNNTYKPDELINQKLVTLKAVLPDGTTRKLNR